MLTRLTDYLKVPQNHTRLCSRIPLLHFLPSILLELGLRIEQNQQWY